MATIQLRRTKTGEQRYRVLVRLKGFPVQSASFRRKTDAKRWGEHVEVALREGRYTPVQEASRHTLAELIARYGEERRSARVKNLKKTMALLSRWAEELGDLTLAEVTAAEIARVRNKLRREVTFRGRKRAPATVNRYLNALSHAFTLASREWGWVEENPVRKVERLREPRGRVRFLDDAERHRLLTACRQSSDERLYALVLLAISSGARQAELMRLHWRDVDLERGLAVLHETKNDERRAIAITGTALEVMRSRSSRADSGFVFASEDGKLAFPRKAWNRACEASGIEDFRFHDLRHTAASYLAMSGATAAEIAEILGHKTLQMVKRYSHLTESHTHTVVARMNAKYL